MKKENATLLRNNLITIQTIICLSGCRANPTDELLELIEDGDNDKILLKAGFNKKDLNKTRKSEHDASEYLGLVMDELEPEGYLIKASIPVPEQTDITDGKIGYVYYSWGYTSFEWFYAPTIDDAIPEIMAWRNKQLENNYKKSKKS